jgi:hypothetical protein
MMLKTYKFKHSVRDDQIIRYKLQKSNFLVVELILHGAHGIVVHTQKCVSYAHFSVHTVIFSKILLFFMRVCKSDYGIWNQYLALKGYIPTCTDNNILPTS